MWCEILWEIKQNVEEREKNVGILVPSPDPDPSQNLIGYSLAYTIS